MLEEGAWTDRPVVDGDPTRITIVLENPQRHFVVIVENEQIFKNTLPALISTPQ